jgi:microcystin degradation protein MlrC
MKRVGVAGLWHETNTYSVRSTSLADFETVELVSGEDLLRLHAGTGTVIGGMLDGEDFERVPLVSAGAWPAGRVTAAALETLLQLLERELRAVARLDGLLLNLHGAMVAEGCDDAELETLQRVRGVVGDIPIAAVLDLHGNPSPEFVRLCDVVIAYDTYPHVDMRDRGREAVALMTEMLAGRPLRTLVRKVPLLTTPLAQATDESPMRDLHALARGLVAEAGLTRLSLLPGFPYSDVARAGFSVLATAEPAAERAAAEAAAGLAVEVEKRAELFRLRRDPPEAAVTRAVASSRRPVILVDIADNVGGGSPGDGTTLLAELVRRRATGAVVTIADAVAARAAERAGPESALQIELGGKTDDRHGQPVPIEVRVIRVTDGRYRTRGTWMTGREFSMGTTALVEADGVNVVVTERAVPPFHAEQLLSLGIDAREASVIVAKGAVAWRAAYGDIAGEVIEVDTPGICPLDPGRLPRITAPTRA